MAEGLLKKYYPEHEIISAGITKHGVNPKAIKVMAESGVDISNHTSDSIDDLDNLNFDLVLTVCDNAKETCPVLPGNHKKLHKNFFDPASATGTEEEILGKFREVRDEIEKYVKQMEI